MAKNIDWKNLGFQYMQTECYVTCEYKAGRWGEIQICTDPHLTLHIAATCLHYGQACFEGLKAFGRKDGSVAMFRPEENAQRLINTGRRLVMEPPPRNCSCRPRGRWLRLTNNTCLRTARTQACTSGRFLSARVRTSACTRPKNTCL